MTLHFSVITVPAYASLPASRHSPIKQFYDDVFFVRGRMPTTPQRPLFARLFVHFSRTMTIVRHLNERGKYELTLFNSIRLGEAGLKKLERLGTIKNIVRLGSFHGVDDAFYVQNYDAEYWIVDGMQSANGLQITPRFLSESHSDNQPVPGSKVFVFRNILYPEAIYILPPKHNQPGLAITTDSIQNHSSIWDVDNSLFVSAAIWRIGLVGKARLGPIWLREQVPKGMEQPLGRKNREEEIADFFRPQFDRLLNDYFFDSLIPGHGWPIRSEAKAAIACSMAAQFPNN